MRIRGIVFTTLVVLLSNLLLSYIALKMFSEFEFIRIGSKRLEVSSLSPSEEGFWASLLGLSVLGFNVGSAIAPRNVGYSLLIGSYSGGWIFKVIVVLIIIGAIGGVIAEYGSSATIASALGTLLAISFGAILTLRVLPPFLQSTGMSAGEMQELISAIAVSQLIGALIASLVTGLISGFIAKLMLYRNIIHVEPLKLPPPPPPNGVKYRFCPNCGFDLGEFSEHRNKCPKCGSLLQK
jgi:hypothetical protein